MLTGIVRDERYLEHMPGHAHPEHPSRLRTIHDMLDKHPPGELIAVPAELATLEELELVHTPTHVKKVLKTAEQPFTNLAPDTPACAKSYLSAWLAVGGCVRAVDALMEHRCEACFCLVRPPGHHALPDRAGGFCFFNNLGIAARYAAKKYRLKRILVIDWDIHHGNGIQELFYSDPSVFYFSTHNMLLYPYSGDMDETGTGAGSGYTVNIPLPRKLGNENFFHIYRETLTPIFRRYRPELVMIAAGFDAHREDPIGRSCMTSKDFRHLTRLLLKLLWGAGSPPLLLSLEGGYNPRALTDSVREVLSALVLPEEEALPIATPSPDTEILVANVFEMHRPYGVWTE